MRLHPAAALTSAIAGTSALLLPTATALAAGHPHAVVTVAHRGASAYAPENTLAAVDAAADLGIDWVENDVQRTKDGELVIMHDTTLNRTTDVEEVFPDRAPWKVEDFTLDEIEKLDAGSWYGPEFKGERVPTLDAYMDRVSANHQNLLMELKSPELYPGIERETLRELFWDGWLGPSHVRSRLIIQSFNAESIKTVHKLRRDIKTGFLGTPAKADLADYAKFTDQINPSYGTIDGDYVSAVHALKGPHHKSLEVYTWTVNSAATAKKVAGLGVDGIITNTPDVVQKALEESGKQAPAA